MTCDPCCPTPVDRLSSLIADAANWSAIWNEVGPSIVAGTVMMAAVVAVAVIITVIGELLPVRPKRGAR